MLILDGHYSHTSNMKVIEKAKENHISLVCLPPKTTHRLQPLDRFFMEPLKIYYSEKIRRLLKAEAKIDIYNIAERLDNAYLSTQTIGVARIFDWGVANHKPYAMTSSKIFKKELFVRQSYRRMKDLKP